MGPTLRCSRLIRDDYAESDARIRLLPKSRIWLSRPLARLLRESPNCISESQRVVQEGPYKNVRHPGYLGVILLWVGAGLATVNWIVAALATLTVIAAYRYRINAKSVCSSRLLEHSTKRT